MEIAIHGTQRRAIVDDEDFERLSAFKWWSAKERYVRTTVKDPSKKRGFTSKMMHRIILGFDAPSTIGVVDHINGDGFDNRKSNLRICTLKENALNVKRRSVNTSGYKGVSFNAFSGKWQAAVQLNGVSYYFGKYDTAELAHYVYRHAAKCLHGAFANDGNGPITDIEDMGDAARKGDSQ